MKNLKYIFFAACLLMLNAVISAQTVYTVTKSTDPDPFVYPYDFNDTICSSEMYGTLQWAIRKANDTEGQCRIVFNISGQAPHTISLEYYLPQITNSVSIDATTQSGYTEENPSIIIDGQNLISTAFYVFEADSIEIKGFRINRMKSTGILLYYCNNAIISDNIITLPNANYNVSKTEFSRIIIMQSSNIYVYNNLLDAYADGIPTPEPYNYGIAVYWTTNCFIGDTLANKQNSILDCYNGVYIDTACQSLKISGNIIDVSSDGIALSSGSNNDKKAPMILRYEEGILKGVGVAGDIIEAFGSTGPEKSMVYLGTATTDSVGNWALSAETGYDYFISTATDTNNNTSKFCNVVLSNPTCAFPINLSSSAGLSTTHTLSWEGTVGTTYGIVVGLKSLTPLDNNWMVSYNQTTADSIVISGLDQNTEYEYYINSRCGTEVSYWAGPLEFNYINNPIVSTELIDDDCGAIDVFLNQVLTAEEITGVDYYEFHVYNLDGFDEYIQKSSNTFKLEELNGQIEYHTTYYIQVRTYIGVLESDLGNTCQITTVRDYPVMDDVVDIDKIRIIIDPESKSIPDLTTSSGVFQFYFADIEEGLEIGFDDPLNGSNWQECVVEVFEHIEEVIDMSNINPVTDPIKIYFGSTNDFDTPEALAIASPCYTEEYLNNINNNLQFDGGNLYNHIITGQSPDYHPTYPYDGLISINLLNPDISTNCNIEYCMYDFYSIILHEATHLLGFVSAVIIENDLVVSRNGDLNFTKFDELFLWYDDDINYHKLVDFEFLLNGGINPIITDAELLTNDIWLTNNTDKSNQPIYSRWSYSTGTSLSHFEDIYIYGAYNSPQFVPNYLMCSAGKTGERLDYTYQELRILQDMGYIINSNYFPFVNNLDNNPPYSTSNMIDQTVSFANAYMNEPIPMNNNNLYFSMVNNTGESVTIYLSNPSALGIVDLDGDPLSVWNGDAGIYNLRGCGINGNNHDCLVYDPTNRTITYTPRDNFIGRAQFGFHVTDDIEMGAFIVCTIDVQKGTAFNNGGDLVINGNFEEGEEVKTLLNPNVPNDKYYIPYNSFLDGKQFVSPGWDDPYIRDSKSICPSGYTLFDGFSSFGSIGNGPESSPDPFNGFDRYNHFAGHIEEFNLTLSENLLQGVEYKLSFDVFPLTWNVPDSYDLNFGFLDNLNAHYSTTANCIQTTNQDDYTYEQWNHHELTFIYDGPITNGFMNVQSIPYNSNTYIHLLIDNISLRSFYINLEETNLSCLGANDGEIEVVVTGGTPPYSIDWLDSYGNSYSGNIISSLQSGEYSVTVTDANGFQDIATTTLTGATLVSASSAVNVEPLCNGYNNGEIVLSILGSTDSYDINWGTGQINTAQTDYTISGLASGTYQITVTDDNGCQDITTTILTELSNLTANVTSQANQVCLTPGSATVEVENGTPDYTYSWPTTAGGVSNNTASALLAGSYDVTIEDINGCSIVQNVIISDVGSITASSSVHLALMCNSDSNGEINVTILDGNASYNIDWGTGNTYTTQNNYTITGLTSETYSITVTDVNGCQDITTTVLTEPLELSVSVQSLANQICTVLGSATIVASGGTPSYTYNWPSNAGGVNYNYADALESGLYTITIVDANNCEIPIDINIIDEGTNFSVSSFVYQNPICYGDENGIIEIVVNTGTPDFTIDWGEAFVTTSNYTSLIESLSANTYNFTITDSYGCQGFTTTILTETPQLTLTADANSFPNCPGEQTILTAHPLGGSPDYTYQWSNSLGTNQTAEVFPSENSTYSVAVSDINGCTAQASVNTEIAYSIGSIISENSCSNTDNGFITLEINANSLNSFPDPVHWSNGTLTTFTQTVTNTYETTVTGLAPGTYTYDVTDALGCNITGSVIIGMYSAPSIGSEVSISCPNENTGSIVLDITNASPPYNYLWSNSAVSEDLYNLPSGNYELTFTYGNNCVDISSYFVDEEPAVELSVNNTTPTYGSELGNAEISFNTTNVGLYDLLITNNFGYSHYQSDFTLADLLIPHIPSGLYTVQVQSANPCSYETQFSIANVFETVTNSCISGNNGTVTLDITVYGAGNTLPSIINWSEGGSSSCVIITPGTYFNKYQSVYHDLAPGTYTYTVTDAWGNTITNTVTVEAYEEPVISTYVTETCSSQPIGSIDLEITNDIIPTSYLWSNGETTQDISNLESGSYNVTITYADNCELISEDISVGQYYSTEVVIDWTHSYVDPNAPYGKVGFYYSNLHSGNYTLLVTNNNDYNETFTFSSTDQLNQINGLNPGLYDMTLTDENGCFTSTQFSIDFVKINYIKPCHNSNTGEIIIDIMTYGADNGITEDMQLQSEDLTVFTDSPETIAPDIFRFSFTGLSAGTYTFHVTDLWENDINSYVIVEEYPEILISVNTVPAYGTEPGVATISFNPANLVGYQVVIESTTLIEDLVFDNPVSPITVELQSGSYTVSVFNLVSDCPPFTYTFDIENVGQIFYNCLSVTPATCDHYYSGSLTFEITGGEPPYTVFVWQGDTELLSNLLYSAPGTYTIQLPESNSTEGFVISGFDYNNHYAAGSIWLDNAYTAYNTFTNDNITNRLQAYQNHIVNQVICIGSELDQTLLFNDNVTFENCTIYTATHAYENVEETRISVRAPYDLILKNCTIESGCPDQMWQGIAAAGACGPQSVNTQSLVVVDGTTISDAMKAVELIHGAIIQASHSNFMNNQYGIFMQPHCNEQTLSYVNYNNFETSRLLNDAEIFPKAHIRMEYSKNLKLKGNNFANTINGTPVLPLNVTYTAEKRGKGIEAELSSFIVTPVYIFDYHSYPANTENTFDGLYYAIDAKGQKTYAPQVYHSIFKNNFRGVHLQGTDGARVLFNYISTTNEPQYFTMVGYSLNGTPNTDVSYGAYLNSAKNTKFEENTILNGKAGAYVYNLGNDGSQYYNNNFGLNPDVNAADYNLPQGMRAATVVVGQNSDFVYQSSEFPGLNGLQVRCNDYTENNFAISVVNGNMRKNQGAYNGQTDQLAGNQFHKTFINGMEFKAQEQNSGLFNYSHLNLGTYNYYQHNDLISTENGFYRMLDESIPNLNPVTYTNIPFVKTDACQSHYSPHIVFDHYTAIGNIAVKTAELDDLEEEYEQIVDKGDTYYMESVAKLMDYENYSEAYEILENEGYLSDTVLIALICNDIAPGDAIAAILIANSPLPEKVIQLIKDLPIDSSIKDWLSLYSAGLSSRIEMEFEMADIKQEIIGIESDLMNNAINNDSSAYVKTDVIKYFNSKPEVTYHDYINIYNLELSLDLLGDALSTLGGIRKAADSLPAEESENVRIFCDVNEIYLGSIDEKTGSSVLSANKDLLFAAASGMSADYSALAEILYLQTTDSVFYEYTPLPVEEVTPKNMVVNENAPGIFTPEFKVYPNPTRGIVIVEYNFDRVYENGTELLLKALNLEKQENCNTGVIKVYNSESKLIKTIKLDNVNGLETINLNKQTAGLYLIEITDCYGNTNSVKIVKNQ